MQQISLIEQNQITVELIMSEYKEDIADHVIAYFNKKKTFARLFRAIMNIINEFSKGEAGKSGRAEIIAVMILNLNFCLAVASMPDNEPKSNLIIPGNY